MRNRSTAIYAQRLDKETQVQIIRLAAGLIDGEVPHHRGYRSEGDDVAGMVARGLLAEDQEQAGIFYATLEGLAFAGFHLPIPPSVRNGCRCDGVDDPCTHCKGGCSDCDGAGRRWQTCEIGGSVVPTFKLEPCEACDGSGWREFEDIPCTPKAKLPKTGSFPLRNTFATIARAVASWSS